MLCIEVTVQRQEKNKKPPAQNDGSTVVIHKKLGNIFLLLF